ADVEDRLIQQHRIHQPKVKLICLENTHNRAGGTCITPQQTHEIAELAQKYNVKLYVDGARIFNAAIALNVDVKSLTKEVDSVSFCLSKGLSAPVGSLILGDREFIDRARVNRQRLGGAMRQAGIIAAPGLIALETMIDRLKEDHENAKTLAKGLVDLGLSVDLRRVQTNIVMIDVSTLGMTSEQFTSKLTELKVKASIYGKTTVRMVTHRGIDASHIKYVIEAVSNIVRMKGI
ncbi:MAG: GntG family PLP-dependent aldolase, partial [Candidatus Bathyarchaeia archaeon]